MNQPTIENKRQLSLGVMLLRLVFSIYLLVTISITVFHMYSDYHLEKRKIDATLDHYREIFVEPVSAALWHLDTEQLYATLNGIKALKVIAGILLVDTHDELLYQSGLAPKTAYKAQDQATLDAAGLFVHSFDINFTDKKLGTLHLYSSNEIVFDSVKYNFLFILVNALIKTAILWLLFLWAFKKHLVGALDEFVAKMKATDFDNLSEIQTHDEHSMLMKSREFSFVNQVFSSMQRRLQHNKQQLDKAKNNLEAQIVQRTKLLVRQQQVMEAMSEQARIGAWEYDLESKSYYWSQMCREIFSVSRNFEPSARATLSFFDDDNASKLEACQARAISHGDSWSIQLLATNSHGENIWLASTGEAEVINGECVRIYGAFQDITESKSSAKALERARDRAEAADDVKTNILTGLSHEIRTPMNGILGMLHLLKSSELKAKQQEQTQTALNSANALMKLLDDLLEISDLKAGNISIDPSNVSLKTLLNDTLVDWQAQADIKELSLQLDIDSLDRDEVFIDANAISKVLDRLISNAIKFSTDGEITLGARIELSTSASQTQQLVLSVCDQGCGIDEAKQADIFESFVKVEPNGTEHQYGPGLGLSIVAQLINLMQGSLNVRSQPAKGSCFEVSVPLISPHSNAIIDADSAKQGQQAHAKIVSDNEARVLIVEDNPINQLVAQAMLEQLNIASDIARDGEEALQMLRLNAECNSSANTSQSQESSNTYNEQPHDPVDSEHGNYHYAMVLMDCLMPVMDGYTATEQIRCGAAGAYYKQLPIVAMTANAMKGDREKCLSAGMDDYLAKPVSPDALQATLRQWFSP